MEIQDWELLAHSDPFGSGARAWFKKFYKNKGLDSHRVEILLDLPDFHYGNLYDSLESYVYLFHDLNSLEFAQQFWNFSQEALSEFYKLQDSPFFRLQRDLRHTIECVASRLSSCISCSCYDMNENTANKKLFQRRYWLRFYRERRKTHVF